MYHLIYTSYASKSLSEEELVALLKMCRKNNQEKNITGILLYLQEKFIQVLEGKKKDIYYLLKKIEADERHQKVTVLLEGTSTERIFKDWHMGFKHVSEKLFHSLSGYEDPDHFFSTHTVTNNSNALYIFLKLFYQKNIVDYHDLE